MRPQCTEDQAALGEISVHHLHPWLIMFGTKTVAGAVKINVGRMVVKIIPEKIKKRKKKAEITTTFNIRPGGDIPTTGGTNRGEGGGGGVGGVKRLVLAASSPWEMIRGNRR